MAEHRCDVGGNRSDRRCRAHYRETGLCKDRPTHNRSVGDGRIGGYGELKCPLAEKLSLSQACRSTGRYNSTFKACCETVVEVAPFVLPTLISPTDSA